MDELNKIKVLFVFLIVSYTSFGQIIKEGGKWSSIDAEVLLNVSGVLGKATGNVNSSTFLRDPVVMGARILRKNGISAWRIGGNFDFISEDAAGNPVQRVTLDKFYAYSLGIEKRIDLEKKLMYYYGFDLTYYHLSSSTRTFVPSRTSSILGSEIKAIRNGPGAGPILGFRWNINDRFSVLTEAGLLFQAINENRYILDQNDFKEILEDKRTYTLRPILPGNIYLTFSL